MTIYVQPRAGWLFPPSALDEVADTLYLRPAVEPSKRPPRELLERFCDLADEPEKVADFVGEYGGLQACEHALPFSHNIPALGDRSRKPCVPDRTPRDDGLRDALRGIDAAAGWLAPGGEPAIRSSDLDSSWNAEPRDVWRQLTCEVADIVRLVDAVAMGDESEQDYRAVYEHLAAHYEEGTLPLFVPDDDKSVP